MEYTYQFLDFLALDRWVVRREGICHACLHVVFENRGAQTVESGLDRSDLLHYLYAVSLLFYHALETPDLSRDAMEALEGGIAEFSFEHPFSPDRVLYNSIVCYPTYFVNYF